MKFTILALVATFVGLISGQAPVLPTCAKPCILNFTSSTTGNIAGCNSLDIKCICSNQDFLSNIACCLVGVCDASDQTAAVAYAKSICTTAGVTVPDAVVCNSANTTSSAPPAPASTATPAATKNVGNLQTAATGLTLVGGFAAALVFL